MLNVRDPLYLGIRIWVVVPISSLLLLPNLPQFFWIKYPPTHCVNIESFSVKPGPSLISIQGPNFEGPSASKSIQCTINFMWNVLVVIGHFVRNHCFCNWASFVTFTICQNILTYHNSIVNKVYNSKYVCNAVQSLIP